VPHDIHRRTPRYTGRSLPSYRYRPGRTPHPRRDVSGHSYAQPEPLTNAWIPQQWRTLESWLYAADLFNEHYWWECHEQLEALWKAAGKKNAPARFVRGAIQIAAACLHRECGKEASAIKQARAGLATIESAIQGHDGTFMGVHVDHWMKDVRRWIEEPQAAVPRIELGITSNEACPRAAERVDLHRNRSIARPRGNRKKEGPAFRRALPKRGQSL